MAAKGSTSTNTSAQPSHDQIAERARKLWMERGSPGGRDLEHWLDAERQLREEAAQRGRASRDSGNGGRGGDKFEAEKRLDGLIEQPPSPARRTPSGENL